MKNIALLVIITMINWFRIKMIYLKIKKLFYYDTIYNSLIKSLFKLMSLILVRQKAV